MLGLEGEATSVVADPTILGLWSFATGTWMVGVVGGGYLPAADLTSLAPTALFITRIAQFVAGLYSFHRDNMFPATAFTCFGAYHVVNGLMFLLHFGGVLNAHNGMNLMSGYFDQSFAFIAFGLLFAIAPLNILLIIITGTTALGSCLIGVAEFYGGASHALGVAYAGGAFLFLDAGWRTISA